MIEFKNVIKTYDGIGAVDNLNLTINEGELCVLLGESGCGKSTTLNMVNRLIEPDSGTITINGKDIESFQIDELRRSIGYVVQSIGLFPHMTVAQNISVVPNLLKWDKAKTHARVVELIETVGLDVDRYINKYPSQLSGGEAQRIGVARALAADPKILLMDEPFGAIDPLNRANLQNEFLNIQQKLGKTVIFVTHDIGEAMKMGDKIALMSKGVLQCFGNPIDLLKSKENEFVRNFMGNDSYINFLNKYNVSELFTPCDEIFNIPTIDSSATLKDALAIMIEDATSVLKTNYMGKTGTINIESILNIMKES
ncbi:MAG: ABC transporter ATP-binding protein [Lachnospirales bacterium]